MRLRLKASGKSRRSGSKLHAVQTLREIRQLRCSRQRLDCVKLASAFESERLSDSFNRTPKDACKVQRGRTYKTLPCVSESKYFLQVLECGSPLVFCRFFILSRSAILAKKHPGAFPSSATGFLTCSIADFLIGMLQQV